MSISKHPYKLRVDRILRRPDGYIACVVWSDGQREWGEQVGPFSEPTQLAVWLEDLEREILEVLDPQRIGLPAELATLRSPGEHAQRCYEVLLEQKGGGSWKLNSLPPGRQRLASS